MRRRTAFISAIISVTLWLFAITPLFPDDKGAPDAKEKAFFIGMGDREFNFNPHHAHTATDVQILTALYEGLLSYHPLTLEPLPAVAYRWEISPDKTVYTFFLRENAFYSNGDPVLAEHFRDSFIRVLNPQEGAEFSVYLDVIKGAAAFRNGKNKDPGSVGIKATADRTLQITLEKPASHFLKLLCLINFVPIHPSYRNVPDWDKKTALIGNGAFVLDRKTKEEIVFVKNTRYWGADDVHIDSIHLRISEDPKVMSQELNAGKIHWTTLQSCDYSLLDARAREKIVPNSMFATSFLFFVCKEKPYTDPRVRRALALLLPWKEIRSRQYSLYPTYRLIPAIPKYPEVKGITDQNIDEAMALLEKAGFPQGRGLPTLSVLISKGNTLYADMIAKAWKDNLKTEVKFKEVESRSFFSELAKHEYTLGSYTWIGDFADPLAFLQMWTSESNLNEALYKNPAYDKLLTDSLGETGTDRYKTLARAEELLLQDAVILPIDHIAAFNIIDYEAVGGWFPNPLDVHPLKYIELKQEKLNKWIVRLPARAGVPAVP
jgi:oligopeptide transport system substrate-binding protein